MRALWWTVGVLVVLGVVAIAALVAVPFVVDTPRVQTLIASSAGPTYSITVLSPPFTVRRRSSSRMRSFAETQGGKRPIRLTRTTRGIFT